MVCGWQRAARRPNCGAASAGQAGYGAPWFGLRGWPGGHAGCETRGRRFTGRRSLIYELRIHGMCWLAKGYSSLCDLDLHRRCHCQRSRRYGRVSGPVGVEAGEIDGSSAVAVLALMECTCAFDPGRPAFEGQGDPGGYYPSWIIAEPL